MSEVIAGNGLNIDNITRLSGRVPLRESDGLSKACVEFSLRGEADQKFREQLLAVCSELDIDAALQENITFANHNLATDGVFGEMHLVMCRNVLIYFDRDLQNRVLSTFSNSLCYNGFLCLGSKETLHFSVVGDDFQEVAARERIYQCKKR